MKAVAAYNNKLALLSIGQLYPLGAWLPALCVGADVKRHDATNLPCSVGQITPADEDVRAALTFDKAEVFFVVPPSQRSSVFHGLNPFLATPMPRRLR